MALVSHDPQDWPVILLQKKGARIGTTQYCTRTSTRGESARYPCMHHWRSATDDDDDDDEDDERTASYVGVCQWLMVYAMPMADGLCYANEWLGAWRLVLGGLLQFL